MSGAAAADVFRRRLAGGGLLVVTPSGFVPGGLQLSLQADTVAIGDALSREDVRQLALVLDEWLFDSRPGA